MNISKVRFACRAATLSSPRPCLAIAVAGAIVGLFTMAMSASEAQAFDCARGVHRAGCVSKYGAIGIGRNGAVVIGRKGNVYVYRRGSSCFWRDNQRICR